MMGGKKIPVQDEEEEPRFPPDFDEQRSAPTDHLIPQTPQPRPDEAGLSDYIPEASAPTEQYFPDESDRDQGMPEGE